MAVDYEDPVDSAKDLVSKRWPILLPAQVYNQKSIMRFVFYVPKAKYTKNYHNTFWAYALPFNLFRALS